jgi:hypothetical protein
VSDGVSSYVLRLRHARILCHVLDFGFAGVNIGLPDIAWPILSIWDAGSKAIAISVHRMTSGWLGVRAGTSASDGMGHTDNGVFARLSGCPSCVACP